MSKIIKVNNEFDFGQAIWSAEEGDTILLEEGEYGYLPYKKGVKYALSEKKSVSIASLIGLGGFQISRGNNFSANSLPPGMVKFGDFIVENINVKSDNIKSIYIFRKTLPFNLRFGCPASFPHANGVILNFLGNDKDTFEFGGTTGSAEAELPKGIVDILVPISVDIDPKRTDPFYSSHLTWSDIPEEEKKRDSLENKDCNKMLGMKLNDIEYRALWAVNHFIRQYGKITKDERIKGFSVAEFLDDSSFEIGKPREEIPLQHSSYLDEYSGQNITQENLEVLYDNFLSGSDYSVGDYVHFHLNHLNYGLATVGMYQEFESLWESRGPKKEDKWKFIEQKTSDPEIKKYLSEMINARNHILHHRNLKTEHVAKDDARGIKGNVLKTEWGAEEMTEYKIFATKRPWYWYKALNDFR